jgi:hypothetical protein
MKIKTGLYVFRVTLTNGMMHEIYKLYKYPRTSKGANAYLTRWVNKVCKREELEWTEKEWAWVAE